MSTLRAKADVPMIPRDVRYVPTTGIESYSITLAACASNDGWIVISSALAFFNSSLVAHAGKIARPLAATC
jgi:hypothetical protein